MNTYRGNSSVLAGILQEGQPKLVGYLTAGYPDRERFFQIAAQCQQAGMHIFEIGFPAADPYADGEIIRKAHSLIDRGNAEDLSFWRRLRETVTAPIWLMGYRADLIDSGAYSRLAQEGLIDGLVVPDMDNRSRKAILDQVKPLGVDMLGFICKAAGMEENRYCLEHFPVVYHQLYSGPTGMVNNSEDYLELLALAREWSDSLLFAGFGIGTAQRAEELVGSGFDGVIVGTAIMKRLEESEEALYPFVTELARAVEGPGPKSK